MASRARPAAGRPRSADGGSGDARRRARPVHPRCASVAVSAALGRVTDQVLRPAFEEGVSSRTVWLGVLAIMGLASLRAVSIMVRRYQSGVAGAAVAATLRRQVSDRYRDLSL